MEMPVGRTSNMRPVGRGWMRWTERSLVRRKRREVVSCCIEVETDVWVGWWRLRRSDLNCGVRSLGKRRACWEGSGLREEQVQAGGLDASKVEKNLR